MIKVEGNQITAKGSDEDIIAEAIGVYTRIFGGILTDNAVTAMSMLFTTIEELADILRSARADQDAPTS